MINRGLAIPGTRPRDLLLIAQATSTWRNTPLNLAIFPNRAGAHGGSRVEEAAMVLVGDLAVTPRRTRLCLRPTRLPPKKSPIRCRQMGIQRDREISRLSHLCRLHRPPRHNQIKRSPRLRHNRSRRLNRSLLLLLSLNLRPVRPGLTIMNMSLIMCSRVGCRQEGRTWWMKAWKPRTNKML